MKDVVIFLSRFIERNWRRSIHFFYATEGVGFIHKGEVSSEFQADKRGW